MKTKPFFYSILLVIASLYSCNKSQTSNSTEERIFSVNLETIKEYEFSDIIDIVEIIPLATSEESLIGDITKLKYHDDKIHILDIRQKSILTFDANGNFDNKIDRVGRGPGEYLDIVDFTINPYTNNLELIDGRVLRTYDECGEFIEQENIINDEVKNIHKIEIIDSDHIGFISLFSEDEGIIYSRKEKSFLSKQCLFPLWARNDMPFGSTSNIQASDGKFYYTKGYSNTVYTMDKNGFKVDHKWDFGQHNFNYTESPLLDEFKGSDLRHQPFRFLLEYTNKYAVQFQSNLQFGSIFLTNFFFKKQPATVIYNATNNKYVCIKGDVSKFLFSNRTYNIKGNLFLMPVSVNDLQKAQQSWLGKENKEIIDNLQLSDNPVLLKMKLKTHLID